VSAASPVDYAIHGPIAAAAVAGFGRYGVVGCVVVAHDGPPSAHRRRIGGHPSPQRGLFAPFVHSGPQGLDAALEVTGSTVRSRSHTLGQCPCRAALQMDFTDGDDGGASSPVRRRDAAMRDGEAASLSASLVALSLA
jgi:hypothetical protein